MQATFNIEDLAVSGLTLETLQDGLSELTIDLKKVVAAEALSKLLGSLSDLYRIGFVAAGRPEIGFISFGDAFVSPDELIITKLEIGTPNKVKVCGCSSVLDDIYKILQILTLAAALTGVAATPTAGSDEVTVVIEQPIPKPDSPINNLLELQRALNENISMRTNLDRSLANGELPFHVYLQEVAKLDAGYKVLSSAMSVTRTKIETDGSAVSKRT